MIPFLTAILWDQAAARVFWSGGITVLALFFAQPTGRTIEERLVTALAGGAGVGVVSAGSARSKEATAEIEALKARIAALEPPTP